jgi:protein gp37
MQWNPWHGCQKISAGCQNCYVYRIDARYDRDASVVYKTNDFNLPLKKNRKGLYRIPSGETVYACFSSDFFLDQADEWRIEAWKMIRHRHDLHFFIITKRIDRFNINLPEDWGDGYANVTICCTCENQERADYRLPIYLSLPIRHKSIICEPLLERMDIVRWLEPQIEQVTVGGESGQHARICDFEWVLNLRAQCLERNIPFHFKQTGAKFQKDNKLYLINRKDQHKQAAKAGIDFLPKK